MIDKQNPLISIIIPMYNAEEYVENIFNNLFQQTYTNYEIIVAYDLKSTDKTLEILENIIQRDDSKQIIIDLNQDSSLGEARNRGFKKANGEFIVSIDVDDELMPDYLESFLKVFREFPELNIVCCGVKRVADRRILKSRVQMANETGEIILYDSQQAVLLNVTNQIPWGTWSHMVRREYMVENNISWPNYSIREDQTFTLRLLQHTTKLGYNTKPTYLYIQRKGSMVHKNFGESSEKLVDSRIEIVKILSDNYSEELYEWMLREKQMISAGFACKHDYSNYRLELHKAGIEKLYQSKYKQNILKIISVVIFNCSKLLYYYGSRIINVKKNDLPLRKIWKNT